jgi:hypothetical protein
MDIDLYGITTIDNLQKRFVKARPGRASIEQLRLHGARVEKPGVHIDRDHNHEKDEKHQPIVDMNGIDALGASRCRMVTWRFDCVY